MKRVHIGTIVSVHGIKGEVKIKYLTENSDDLLSYGALTSEDCSRIFELRITGHTNSGQLIVAVKGVTDRNTAESLKNQKLYVSADAMPALEEDDFYHHQLIGLAVFSPEQQLLGKILAVHNFGAGDIIEIEFIDGRSEMFPFIEEIFPNGTREGITFVAPEILE